jgi:hypothetical protein
VSSSAENKEEIRSSQLVQVDSMLSKLSKMNEVSWLLVVGHYPIHTGGNYKYSSKHAYREYIHLHFIYIHIIVYLHFYKNIKEYFVYRYLHT